MDTPRFGVRVVAVLAGVVLLAIPLATGSNDAMGPSSLYASWQDGTGEGTWSRVAPPASSTAGACPSLADGPTWTVSLLPFGERDAAYAFGEEPDFSPTDWTLQADVAWELPVLRLNYHVSGEIPVAGAWNVTVHASAPNLSGGPILASGSSSHAVHPRGPGTLEIPLHVHVTMLPAKSDLHMVIRLDAPCGSANPLRLDSSTELTFTADDAPRIAFVHPQWMNGTFVVHGAVSSPWGLRDLSPEHVELFVDDQPVPEWVDKRTNRDFPNHARALDITWVWPPGTALEPGDHALTLRVASLQQRGAQFTQGYSEAESRTTPAPAVFLALIAAGLAMKRRQEP